MKLLAGSISILAVILTLSTTFVSSQEEELTLVYKDDSAIVYFNETIDKTKTKWIFNLYSKTWKHVRRNFGIFGGSNGGRLLGRFQTTSGEGWLETWATISDVSVFMDISRGALQEGSLYDKVGTNQPEQRFLFDAQLREICKLIEEGNNGMEGSPAYSVWGKRGFTHMIVYDIFSNIGYTKELEEWKQLHLNEQSDTATAKNIVYWLRDWWLPMYDKYGKTALLGRFFKLVAQYWPKDPSDTKKYQGGMEVGQFVHFFSGAAKTNLKEHATNSLGWEQVDEDSFNKAKRDFPYIRY